jgi:two-component system, chemotaxis family, chemotaxis protein CheY
LETDSIPFAEPLRHRIAPLHDRRLVAGGNSVLIVEDDEDIRGLLVESLETNGFDVSEAGDGLEAWEILDAGFHPDVVVLDLMMPRMNGWAFLEKLRADPELAQVPVLITSAFSDLRSVDASAYLAKPFRMDEFDETVARLCGAKN